jgi:hypothetical protein
LWLRILQILVVLQYVKVNAFALKGKWKFLTSRRNSGIKGLLIGLMYIGPILSHTDIGVVDRFGRAGGIRRGCRVFCPDKTRCLRSHPLNLIRIMPAKGTIVRLNKVQERG